MQNNPLLKDKIYVLDGKFLNKRTIYAKSHQGFFTKEDLETNFIHEYFFEDEKRTWFRSLNDARKLFNIEKTTRGDFHIV